MKAAKLILTLLTFFGMMSVKAQLPSSGQTTVLDGVYQQTHIPTKRVIAYSPLREADVLWTRRIWRRIETKERINFPLFYPEEPISDRMALWDVIKYAVFQEGSLTIYDPSKNNGGGDQFTKPILPANGNRQDPEYIKLLEDYFGTISEVQKKDDEGEGMVDDEGAPIMLKSFIPYSATNIIAYEVKEEWFFDKQRSQMDVRIIGICPVVYKYDDAGTIAGEKNCFGFIFQNQDMFSRISLFTMLKMMLCACLLMTYFGKEDLEVLLLKNLMCMIEKYYLH
jgi:gliding motility associated protien GldN